VRFPEAMKTERDCGCPVVFARYVVRAIAPNGRTTTAVGLCSMGEKNRRFTRQDHDISTTAYTRAANRAISDMIGAGEISAEEARATGEARGLSQEDRARIRTAWEGAGGQRRDAAVEWLRREGFEGATTRDVLVDFSRSAEETQVEALIAELTEDELTFDPDLVPVPDAVPT